MGGLGRLQTLLEDEDTRLSLSTSAWARPNGDGFETLGDLRFPMLSAAQESEDDLRNAEPSLARWPDGFDEWVDELIERFYAFFPFVAACHVPTEWPSLWQDAIAAWRTDPEAPCGWTMFPGSLSTPSVWHEDEDVTVAVTEYLAAAIWWRTRSRRSWPRSVRRCCPVCGELYSVEDHDVADVIEYGDPVLCPYCSWGLYGDVDHDDFDEALTAIRHLAAVTDTVPSANWPKAQLHNISSVAHVAAARLVMPSRSAFDYLRGEASWTQCLQDAGVLGDLVPTSRGALSTASDGHHCRSLFERAIEEWLIARGVNHDVEPVYPFHLEHNPTGQRRADWLLEEWLWVEAAGLNDTDYLLKLRHKQALASAVGLELVILKPRHVDDLDQYLGLPLGLRRDEHLGDLSIPDGLPPQLERSGTLTASNAAAASAPDSPSELVAFPTDTLWETDYTSGDNNWADHQERSYERFDDATPAPAPVESLIEGADRWIAPFDPDAWTDDEVEAWWQADMDPEEAHPWRELGFEPEEALGYTALFGGDISPFWAATWLATGIDPQSVEDFVRQDLPPSVATAWASHGFVDMVASSLEASHNWLLWHEEGFSADVERLVKSRVEVCSGWFSAWT